MNHLDSFEQYQHGTPHTYEDNNDNTLDKYKEKLTLGNMNPLKEADSNKITTM